MATGLKRSARAVWLALLALYVVSTPAWAQNVTHPLYLFDDEFAREAAFAADCARAVQLKPEPRDDLSVNAFLSAHMHPECEAYARSRLIGSGSGLDEAGQPTLLADAVERRTRRLRFAEACPAPGAYMTTRQKLAALLWPNALERASFPCVTDPGWSIIPDGEDGAERYAVRPSRVIGALYKRYPVDLGSDLDATITIRDVIADAICPERDVPDGQVCGPVRDDAAQSLRRSLERMLYLAAPEHRTGHARLNNMFVVRTGAEPAEGSDSRLKDDAFAYVIRDGGGCQGDLTSECRAYRYHVHLAFAPGGQVREEGEDGLLILADAPSRSSLEAVRYSARSVLGDRTTELVERRRTVRRGLRIGRGPEDFIPTRPRRGAQFGVDINADEGEETFSFNGAVGYRISTRRRTRSNDASVNVSLTPFAAWQRRRDVTRDSSEPDVIRNDVLFFGGVAGFERVLRVPRAAQFADYWTRPSWRGSLSAEYVTDSDFDAEVYRVAGTLSPPMPERFPNFGYRNQVQLGDLFRSYTHDRVDRDTNASASQDRLAPMCAGLRVLCTTWVEWDFAAALDHVDVVTPQLNFSTRRDLTDRIEENDGTRFGYDLRIEFANRSIFALVGERPWFEVFADYKNARALAMEAGMCSCSKPGSICATRATAPFPGGSAMSVAKTSAFPMRSRPGESGWVWSCKGAARPESQARRVSGLSHSSGGGEGGGDLRFAHGFADLADNRSVIQVDQEKLTGLYFFGEECANRRADASLIGRREKRLIITRGVVERDEGHPIHRRRGFHGLHLRIENLTAAAPVGIDQHRSQAGALFGLGHGFGWVRVCVGGEGGESRHGCGGGGQHERFHDGSPKGLETRG